MCGLIVGDIQHIPRQSLQILDLNLDRDQLAFVADGHFKELRKLIIRPKKSEADSPIPAMTFTQFLKILKNLPALTNLGKFYSQVYKSITQVQLIILVYFSGF